MQLKSPTLTSSPNALKWSWALGSCGSILHLPTLVLPGLSLGLDICGGPSFTMSLIPTSPPHVPQTPAHTPLPFSHVCLPLLLDAKHKLVPEGFFVCLFSGKELFLRYLFWRIAQVRKFSSVSGPAVEGPSVFC